MARIFVGTMPCPMIQGRDAQGQITCVNTANVYRDDSVEDYYCSKCVSYHELTFGGYMLDQVDDQASEISIPDQTP